jgi:hypothetical protein
MQRRVLFYFEAKEEVKDDENHLCGLVCQISLPKCRAFLTSNYNINTTHRHRDCLDSAKDAQAISSRVWVNHGADPSSSIDRDIRNVKAKTQLEWPKISKNAPKAQKADIAYLNGPPKEHLDVGRTRTYAPEGNWFLVNRINHFATTPLMMKISDANNKYRASE